MSNVQNVNPSNYESDLTGEKMISYVKLMDGESFRGYLLTTDLVLFYSHSDFKRGIISHTCTDPKYGKKCLSCQHGIKRVKKTIVPVFNADLQEVQIFYATPMVAQKFYAFIDEYDEEATSTPIMITRQGSGLETTYKIMPTRVRVAEKVLFEVQNDIVIDDVFYLKVLNPPSEDRLRELLNL